MNTASEIFRIFAHNTISYIWLLAALKKLKRNSTHAEFSVAALVIKTGRWKLSCFRFHDENLWKVNEEEEKLIGITKRIWFQKKILPINFTLATFVSNPKSMPLSCTIATLKILLDTSVNCYVLSEAATGSVL